MVVDFTLPGWVTLKAEDVVEGLAMPNQLECDQRAARQLSQCNFGAFSEDFEQIVASLGREMVERCLSMKVSDGGDGRLCVQDVLDDSLGNVRDGAGKRQRGEAVRQLLLAQDYVACVGKDNKHMLVVARFDREVQGALEVVVATWDNFPVLAALQDIVETFAVVLDARLEKLLRECWVEVGHYGNWRH